MTDLETQEAIAWANKVIKAKGTSYTPASRNAAAFILASCALQDAAPVEPLCPFTDRPAWECAAACTCAHFKPTGIIKHTNPPAAPTDALVEKSREWAIVVREADKQWSQPLSTLLEQLAAAWTSVPVSARWSTTPRRAKP